MKIKEYYRRMVEWMEKHNIERKFRITYDIIANIVLVLAVAGFLLLVFAGGVGAGYFASLVKDEPIQPYEEMKKEIYNYEETSKLYFADNIYIGDIRADLHREEVSLDEVSDLVKQAVIATEDELFYEHDGVVPKAILRALFQEVTNAEQKTGGSTLTQQLIKNQILTNEVSFERKAKEILLALRLENFFEKDEILEAYLNIVPFGRDAAGQNIAGIQTAARGIFDVDANELNLPQAAYLAGLPQNPFKYTPFTSSGELKDEEGLEPGINRMKTVLYRMHQTGIIDEKEYKEALEYDITADFTKKSNSPIEEYPAIVFELEQRATEIIKEILAEKDGYTKEELQEDEQLNEQYAILADRALRRNGYHIHSTINKKMYDKMQKIVSEYQYFGPDRTVTKDGETVVEQVENGAVLIENKTGKILSFVPGRDFRAGDREFNYATKAHRSPGSTFKPFAYAIGFETGKFQPGSVFADIPTSYGSYSPKNYGGAIYGLVTVREAMTYSYNITAVKAYSEVMNDDPIGKYFSKLGFKRIDKSESGNRSLVLGGLTHGVTVEENTAAFTTFANGGQYVEPYMIEKITDKDGNVIYEHKPEPVQVFSPQTSYLIVDIMRDVTRHGTAAYLQSQLKYGGVDWAGKTGTSQDYKDAWFIGVNPNVTFGSWIGYDTPASIYCANCSLSYHQRNIKLWAQMVNALTEEFPEIMAPKERFARPDGIVSRSFCATSGLLPSKLCQEAGLVRSDLFNAKFVPKEEDDSLIGGNMPLVIIDGEQVVAGPNTPEEFTLESKGGIMFNPEFLKRMKYDQLGDLSVLIPRRNRESWEKIGLAGDLPSSFGTVDASSAKAPSAPGGLKSSGNTVSWKHQKGQLIVGYRIYYAAEDNQQFQLIGHTTEPSYKLPDKPGYYHVRAVNYFGQESKPSAQIVLEAKEEKPKDEGSQKQKEQPKQPQPSEPKETKPKDKPKDEPKEDRKQDENENKEDNKDATEE